MKLKSITEGISIDPNTKALTFDFENDSPDDVVKFFDNSMPVIKLSAQLYVGFAFAEMSPSMVKHQEQQTLTKIGKALAAFQQKYRGMMEKHAVKGWKGPEIQDMRAFQAALDRFAPYQSLKNILGDDVDAVIAANPTNSVSVISGVTKLIGQNYDVDLMRQYINGTVARVDTRLNDLKSEYKAAARAIVRQINTGTAAGNPDIEHFMYFAAERLAKFNGFGFRPNVLIYPFSSSELLEDFVQMVAADMGVPAVEGLRKKRSDVYYNDGKQRITLVDANGQVNPDLSQFAGQWVGDHLDLPTVAQKIATDRFKITHVYPDNRTKIEGFMEAMPEFRQLVNQGQELEVLLIDDSIFSGSTQVAMMDALKQYPVKNIASYALISAKA